MNTKHTNAPCRILAFDVRPRRLAYAVFEMPSMLVDFGVTRFHLLPTGIDRATSWMVRFHPSILVLRKIERRSTRDRHRTKTAMHLIRTWARHHSIRVSLVTHEELQTRFPSQEAVTKHERAALLARAFPELAARLPSVRKPWERENWHMPIFDAVALGTCYLAVQSNASAAHLLTDQKESSFAGPSVA